MLHSIRVQDMQYHKVKQVLDIYYMVSESEIEPNSTFLIKMEPGQAELHHLDPCSRSSYRVGPLPGGRASAGPSGGAAGYRRQ